MEYKIKTKANIGDTIYFLYNNQIVSDIIKFIGIDIKAEKITTTYFFYDNEDRSGYGCMSDDNVEDFFTLSIEDLLQHLENNFKQNKMENENGK